MATKTAATKASAGKAATKAKPAGAAETPEKDGAEAPATDSPLLDLSDAAVRKMIKLAKKRGWVSHDQINAVLPSEEVTSDQSTPLSPRAVLSNRTRRVRSTLEPRPHRRGSSFS